MSIFDHDITKQTIIKHIIKNLSDIKHLIETWSTKVVNREVKKINYKHHSRLKQAVL